MNIYVETNFVLELVFEQEQSESCEQILELCESNQAKLIIPAYSLAEPHEKLNRQAINRRNLQQLLNKELGQLSRNQSYSSRIERIQDIASLMVQSNQEEWQRFVHYRDKLLRTGEIIALTSNILEKAASCETTYDFKSQDAIVYASVVQHLNDDQPKEACFLNRNSKDFDSQDIVDDLKKLNCRMIFRFDDGYSFIQSQSF